MTTTTKSNGDRNSGNGSARPAGAAGEDRQAPTAPSGPGRNLGKCVICGKPQLQKFRPFCSGRCADVDLHNWVAGNYRIPTDETPDEAAANADGGDPSARRAADD